MRWHPLWAAVLSAAALIGGSGTVEAQAVRGHVTLADGSAAAGVFVILLDDAGRRHAASLTRPDGLFSMHAPHPGRFVLRAELIGYASAEVTVEVPASGAVTQPLQLAPQPIRLDLITVDADRRCRTHRDAGGATQAVWEEARKALAVAAWMEERPGVIYQTVLYEHTRSLDDDGIIAQAPRLRQHRSGLGTVTFRTSSPAVWAGGFVRRGERDGYVYDGLDAALLLSDEFVETHCFRLGRGGRDEGDLLRLEFEPLPTQTLPDVRGVILLDAASFELRRVEFTYTAHLHAADLPPDRFGGSAVFQRLENGAWITSEWRIRMPQFLDAAVRAISPAYGVAPPATAQERRAAATLRGLAVREAGGQVLFAAAPQPEDGSGIVAGVVHDSVRGRPLAGALVFTTHSAHTARTNQRGEFTLRGLPAGRHDVGFVHGFADSLRLPLALQTVEVAGEPARVQLGIPAAEGCPAVGKEALSPWTPEQAEAATGAVRGVVVDARTGIPVAGAAVEATWQVRLPWSLRDALRGIAPLRSYSRTARAGDDGRFLLCHLPTAHPVRLRAGRGPVEIIEWGTRAEVFQDLVAR